MDLTHSYERVFPPQVLDRYEFVETRNAAAVLAASDPAAFDDLVAVVGNFQLLTSDLTTSGGNQSALAGRLNEAIRAKGFREAAVDTTIELRLEVRPYRPAGEETVHVDTRTVTNKGFRTDGFRGRVAVDVEWNAKDGHLDRDLAAYRALYELALIDAAVLITRTHFDLRDLAFRLRKRAGMADAEAATMLRTTTTTNIEKLRPKLTRGDAGGCPVLGICISRRTWEGHGIDEDLPDVAPPPVLDEEDDDTPDE